MNEVVFTEKNKSSFFKAFLDRLLSLASKEKQLAAWENGDYSSYVDFSEVYMCFSDACEPILTWMELSNHQHQELQAFYEMVENYDRYLSDRKKLMLRSVGILSGTRFGNLQDKSMRI